jgi:hypothetical protein
LKAPIELDGKTWPTTEHYFQAKKFEGHKHEEVIRNAATCTECKSLGQTRLVPLRADWEEVIKKQPKEKKEKKRKKSKAKQSKATKKRTLTNNYWWGREKQKLFVFLSSSLGLGQSYRRFTETLEFRSTSCFYFLMPCPGEGRRDASRVHGQIHAACQAQEAVAEYRGRQACGAHQERPVRPGKGEREGSSRANNFSFPWKNRKWKS